LAVDAFAEEPGGCHFRALTTDPVGRKRRNKDDWWISVRREKCLLQIKATHPRHLDVRD
jgi:hypothetical protein